MSKPYLVGITGGIGSGKSIVTKIFSLLGVPIYDADSRAKWLMENDAELIHSIKDAFSDKAYLENGKLNRPWLASEVFSNPEKTELINSLVHPRVGEDGKQWIAANANHPYLVKEAALMYESGSYKELDFIVAVYAPERIRIRRVLLRDLNRSSEDVKNIIARQMPDEEKKKKAHAVIVNDDQRLVIPQVISLHKQLLKSALL
ncbi:dephospho-CoA kinase [Peijinzhouia sedimentorum]